MTEKLPEFFHLVRLEKVGSTNEEAINLASVGAASGTIVWASEQTQGRGRHFRKWDSPLGNLYFSIILRPLAPVSSWSQASFISSISVRSGINNLFPELKPKLKWPNDIFLNGKTINTVNIMGTAIMKTKLIIHLFFHNQSLRLIKADINPNFHRQIQNQVDLEDPVFSLPDQSSFPQMPH